MHNRLRDELLDVVVVLVEVSDADADNFAGQSVSVCKQFDKLHCPLASTVNVNEVIAELGLARTVQQLDSAHR